MPLIHGKRLACKCESQNKQCYFREKLTQKRLLRSIPCNRPSSIFIAKRPEERQSSICKGKPNFWPQKLFLLDTFWGLQFFVFLFICFISSQFDVHLRNFYPLGVLNEILHGEAPPLRSNPLPFYIPFLTEKVRLSYTFFRQAGTETFGKKQQQPMMQHFRSSLLFIEHSISYFLKCHAAYRNFFPVI